MYREIVTKAVIGKGKKCFKNNYCMTTPEAATTVLGCWVINHKFRGRETGGKVVIDGSYDVNIWYSYDNDSKTSVVTKRIDYSECVHVRVDDDCDLSNDTDIIVRTLKQPNCCNVEIDGCDIRFTIEKELGIEVVGETKLKIMTEDACDDWEVLEDCPEVTPEVEEEIDSAIDENFIDGVN